MIRRARYRMARMVFRVAFRIDGTAFPRYRPVNSRTSPWVAEVPHVPMVMTHH